MQKIKDVLAKVELNASNEGSAIVLDVHAGPLAGSATMIVGDDKRLHVLLHVNSSRTVML